MKALIMISALLIAIPTWGQQKNALLGTWKLVSDWTVRPNGERVAPYGEHPVGFLTYTADGRVFAILGRSDRKPLHGDRFTAPEPERAEAYSTALGYTGRYTIDSASAKVVHHVEVATFPDYVGTDQVREMKLEGDRLTLRATLTMGGEKRASELVWMRLK